MPGPLHRDRARIVFDCRMASDAGMMPKGAMSECEEIANTINRLVEAGHIAKAQELLELALDDYFVLQLAMFANTKLNAYATIAAWKQAGLRLPAEDTDEFYPYRDSPSVTEETQ